MEIQLKELQCAKCGHKWLPRKKEVKACPRCRTIHWREVKIPKWHKIGMLSLVGFCGWVGCQESLAVKGSPDYFPEGWQRLVVSKGSLAKNMLPADIDSCLCPKHCKELLSLLKIERKGEK